MGKTLTHDEAVTASENATAARKAARKELEAFATSKGLNAKKDHSEDKEHGKAYKKLRKVWSDAKAAEEASQKLAKELKPASERNTKHDYPADVTTAEEKKKYRAKARAAAKKAEKDAANPDGAVKAPKKDKAAKKEEAAAPVADAKKKKKKAKPSDED